MAGDRPEPVRLTLYGREGCHLCDEMAAALQPLRAAIGFELRIVDVDGDPELQREYGLLLPVLAAGDRELCRHVLDAEAVRAYFSGIG